MSTTFKISNQELQAQFPKLQETSKPIVYHIGWDEKFTARNGNTLVPVGIAQRRDDVPSRSNVSSDAFAFDNILSDQFGTNPRTSIYRGRELVNKENAEKLQVGMELTGLKLFVKDQTEPHYDGQEPYVGRNGESRLHNGQHIYTTTVLKKENQDKDVILTLDTQNQSNNQSESSEESVLSEFTVSDQQG